MSIQCGKAQCIICQSNVERLSVVTVFLKIEFAFLRHLATGSTF